MYTDLKSDMINCSFGSVFSDFVSSLPVGKTYLIYVGQAGYLIKSSTGRVIAIDIYLSNCVERVDGFRRLMPHLFEPGDIKLDYILASHAHFDHFDVDSMGKLMSSNDAKLIASEGCATLVREMSLDEGRTTYVRAGESNDFGDFLLDSVFCDHGKAAPDAVGFIVCVDGFKIYFAGDTSLHIEEAQKLLLRGPFDVMVGPINGHWGNLSEKEMVTLCSIIKPQIAIPCHYWCFAQHGGDPELFIEEMKKQTPAQKYRILALGEALEL